MGSNLSLLMISKLQPADLRTISEADFQYAVVHHAQDHGWRVQTFRKSAALGASGEWQGLGGKGWPDVVGIRGGWLVAIECKAEDGRGTPDQKEWIAAFKKVYGAVAMFARPRDAAEVMRLLE